MSTNLKYVVITPARNEAQFIELTLKAVTTQTVLPLKWVIVSDGSTDGTDDIVKRYAAEHSWIELVRMPERQARNFAGKVLAFNAGYAQVQHLKYQVIASLDADITLPHRHFEYLLGKLEEDQRLGLVGTPFQDGPNSVYDYRFVNIEHVSGACQVFRRECFEQIGGYRPLQSGGIDYHAVISARMKGWKTRTFTDMLCVHHREMGTAQHGVLASRFKYGVKDYAFGNHPLWEISRTLYQFTRRPLFVGGLALFCGYAWSACMRSQRTVTKEMMQFTRREQILRLKRFVARHQVLC